MERKLEDIREEMKKRGLECFEKNDINSWALVFVLEDLIKAIEEN